MTILVTGGAGFIGSNFIFYAMKRWASARIVCVDKLTYAGCYMTLAPLAGRADFRFVPADICDRAAMFSLFEQERPDAVVNFAAESHVDRSIETPGVFLETNVLGTQVLMDACRAFHVGRFHQVSTDEVYGELPLDRPELLFTEQTPLHASSPYSASKAGADLLVQAYCRTFGLNATISRCSNNYGPYQFPEKLIPLMIAKGLSGEALPVYGEGINVRDWLYVEDHCEAIALILERGQPREVYNVGGSCEMRNIDVVRRILGALGLPQERIAFVPDRKGHDLRYAIDASKIRRELGWSPKTGFDQGIDGTIRWYCENRSWWERILSGEYRKDSP